MGFFRSVKALFGKPDAVPSVDDALAHYRAGRYKKALDIANRMLEAGPEIALSWRFKGECLFQLERFIEASRCFEKARLLGGPGVEDVFLWQALSEYNAGDVSAAVHTVKRFLESAPQDPDLIEKARNALAKMQG